MRPLGDDELLRLLDTSETDLVEFKESLAGSAPEKTMPGALWSGRSLAKEITRNAVMHRTYEATNAPVHVRWFSDRIEVMSPGGPFGQVTAGNFGKPGVVDYRNPNLTEALRTLGFIQRFGIGIPTAQKLLQETGHSEATFRIEYDAVLATIPAIHSSEEVSR